ncbi:hypothetical protein KFE98_08135 [bacterium SCSIO 12741]|nr:hypothetical protein KFE98_08135 [bacterium SCSIO 12741]
MNALELKTHSWRNTLVSVLGLNENSFQLIQGSLPIGSTSENLYLMADSVPPASSNFQFNASQWNRFSEDYGSLLHSLSPGNNSSQLQAVLGDNYTNWIKFRNAYYAKGNQKSQADVFKLFADEMLDPGVAQTAINTFAQSALSPLEEAMADYTNTSNFLSLTSPSGQVTKVPVYNTTIEKAQAAIRKGRSASINYDSTSSNEKKSSFFTGAMDGAFGTVFAVAGAASDKKTSQMITNSKITISGSINNYATLPVGPGDWFNSGVFNNALKNKNDDYVWNPDSSSGWSTFFGAGGSMDRVITELIIADGIDLTITVHETFSDEQLSSIQQGLGGGFWPFYAGAEGSSKSNTALSTQDGKLHIPYKTNIGDISILGANVTAIESAF